MNCFFSIIIPTYNRSQKITTTIDSVLQQSNTHFEILIIDDGSTDNTEEVVKSIQDPRIRYFKKQNEERAIARNYGIERAKGDYITFLDSDDILYPNHFKEANKIINEKNSREWFHLAYEIRDEKGKMLRQENKRNDSINYSLITGNHLSCIGIFVRKDIMKENLFNEDPKIIGSEDYELWLRLASKYPLHYSNTITSCIIQHSDRSVISSFDDLKLVERMDRLIEIVEGNSIFNQTDFKIFKAHRYAYLSLHLAMNKNRRLAFNYLKQAILLDSHLLVHRKTMGILKNLV